MDFESADESSISNIRQDYTYEFTDHYCACINYGFRMTFLERVEKLKIKDNLLELEKKITAKDSEDNDKNNKIILHKINPNKFNMICLKPFFCCLKTN